MARESKPRAAKDKPRFVGSGGQVTPVPQMSQEAVDALAKAGVLDLEAMEAAGINPLALTPSISNEAANAAADAVAALCNGGSMKFYDGTMPANADTALSGNTLLATCPLSATAFGAAANGVATANAITSDASADATSTCTFYRLLKSNGTSVVMQGSVGTSGANINFNSVAFQSGAEIAVSGFTYTQNKT